MPRGPENVVALPAGRGIDAGVAGNCYANRMAPRSDT